MDTCTASEHDQPLTLRVSRAIVGVVSVDANRALHSDVQCGREEGQQVVCRGDSGCVQLNPVASNRNQDVVVRTNDRIRNDLGDLGVKSPTV